MYWKSTILLFLGHPVYVRGQGIFVIERSSPDRGFNNNMNEMLKIQVTWFIVLWIGQFWNVMYLFLFLVLLYMYITAITSYFSFTFFVTYLWTQSRWGNVMLLIWLCKWKHAFRACPSDTHKFNLPVYCIGLKNGLSSVACKKEMRSW